MVAECDQMIAEFTCLTCRKASAVILTYNMHMHDQIDH